MKTLIIIDVQNEFSSNGKRPVPEFLAIVGNINKKVEKARAEDSNIAWIRHFNKVTESPAFVPGTWGSEFASGMGPNPNSKKEIELHKDVYGAFTGTEIDKWLRKNNSNELEIMGFYTHGCVSTTAREAIMLGYDVSISISGTATCDLEDTLLGHMSAAEIRRAALLQLSNMGVTIYH